MEKYLKGHWCLLMYLVYNCFKNYKYNSVYPNADYNSNVKTFKLNTNKAMKLIILKLAINMENVLLHWWFSEMR